MKKRILWTTAALLTTALGAPLSSYAELTQIAEASRVNRQATSTQTLQPTQLAEVVKVGSYQSPSEKKALNTSIARIQPHELAGRQAATLYVRNIPVLTFLGANAVAKSNTKVGTAEDTKDATLTNNPEWRATAVAARLNQMSLDGVKADKITVKWQKKKGSISSKDDTVKTPSSSYLIQVNEEKLVEIDTTTRLPDTTNDLAEDALQATNRLRRIIGNAPPLGEIAGLPTPSKLPSQIAFGPVRIRLSGVASWYGPGFHGNRSASGEIYNQNALTAAHRSLPFGTKVRVTNTGNGRSVVVRINDRGPYAGGRIIDLSAAAARLIGVMQTGVAPVRVDVLSN